MKRKVCWKIVWQIIVFVCVFTASPTYALNQDQAQRSAAVLHRIGSNQSLQQSSVNTMVAVMNAASLNIPGAVVFGTMAYGDYRNSEELDLTSDITAMNDIMMGSQDNVGGTLKKMKAFKTTKTTYNRLNPSFLREGKAAVVAAEFERQSGLSREKFLTIMGDVSEAKVAPDDPNMVDTVLTRFEGLVEHIPNQEFRANLKTAIDKVPNTVRRGIVGKAVHGLASFMAELGINQEKQSKLSGIDPKRLVASLNKLAANKKVEQESTKDPALSEKGKPPKTRSAKINGKPGVATSDPSMMLIDNKRPATVLKSLFGENPDDSVNKSIFKRVSERYALLQKAGFGN